MCKWILTPQWGWAWTCCECHNLNPGPVCQKCGKTVCPTTADETFHLLIIGCARGATQYAAELIKTTGAEFGHESLMPDGMASSFATPHVSGPHLHYSGKFITVTHADFEHVIHQVRHPLHTIGSWILYQRRLGLEQMLAIQANTSVVFETMKPLEIAMRYWLEWNQVAEGAAEFSYQVEEMAKWASRIYPLLGECGNWKPSKVKRNVNASPADRLTIVSWIDLDNFDKGLARQIRELAVHYGYDLLGA